MYEDESDKASFYSFSGNVTVYRIHLTIKKHVNEGILLVKLVTRTFSGNYLQTVMFDIWYFQW